MHFLEHGLEPLFEFAAVLGSGDQRAHVERHDALVLEAFGNVAAHDALGQALDDRGLADAGLADEHRVVLRSPRQDLDDAPDLVVAADNRIELAGARRAREVAAVLLERLVGALGIGRRDALVAANFFERGQRLLARQAGVAQKLSGRAALVQERQQKVLDRNVVIVQLGGLVTGLQQDPVGLARERGLLLARVRARHVGQGRNRCVDLRTEGARIDLRLFEQGGDDALILGQQRGQDVFRLDAGIVLAQSPFV